MMIKWVKDLFPICRSITGHGIRKTLSYFEKINPEFKSGTKVFDWLLVSTQLERKIFNWMTSDQEVESSTPSGRTNNIV